MQLQSDNWEIAIEISIKKLIAIEQVMPAFQGGGILVSCSLYHFCMINRPINGNLMNSVVWQAQGICLC